MDSIIGIVIVLTCLFVAFYVLGAMLERKLDIEVDSFCRIILGFILFLFAFVVIDVPLEYAHVPFHVLAYGALFVWIMLAGYSIYYVRKIEFPSKAFWNENTTFGFLLVVGVEIWYGMRNAIYTSYSDAAYYNMSSITSIYTNTIFEYDQFSGLAGFDPTRAQDSSIILVAVLSKISHMHVLIMVNRVMAVLEIVMFNLILYEIALILSKKNKKIAFLTVFFYFVISLFYWMNGGENLLWGRLAETKSMLANIYIPVVLLCFSLLAGMREKKRLWILIMCAVTVGVALSFSGTYIVLAFTFYLVLSYWLLNGRKIQTIIYAALAVTPSTVIMLMRTFL